MKPTTFPGCNVVYAKDQPPYLPLPANKSEGGAVTTCWRGGFLDRLRFCLTGRMYVTALTFNRPLQPMRLSTRVKAEKEGR